jgi:peptide/nickel transport system substrate-binding protein
VTADDVRFTWELQVDTTVAWPGASMKSRIRNVEVKDARTVVFHFRERYLYQVMDANDGVILPKHLLESIPRKEVKSSAFGRAPVGNGPYRIARWEPGQYLELTASEQYFGRKPRVERVVFKIVPDAVTLVLQLKAGEIDLLESVQAGDLAAIREARPDVVIHTVPSRRLSFIAWNLTRDPFADREVRRADGGDRPRRNRPPCGAVRPGVHQPIVRSRGLTRHPPILDRSGARSLPAQVRDSDGDGILTGKPLEFELLTHAPSRIDVVPSCGAAQRSASVNLR